ncbi:MAG: hypothetical protein KDK70_34530, partial [Myxococcales bacterium]|nr:hypothetical protein [Myxococcales bacterium]
AKRDQRADAVIGLRKALADLQTVGQRGLHEVGMLVGLSQYCDLLLDQEGNPEPGESPLADFQEFLQRSAIPRFLDQLVCDPVDLAPDAARRRDRFAREILRILDDPEFVAGVQLVVTHHDVVPHALLDNMYHYLTAAADLLSVTQKSETFAERHALPMMRGLAELPSKEFDETIDEFEDEELREGMAEGWRSVLPDRDTVFKLAIGIGTGVIGSVSNLEGPRSLGVAVMMQYQIHLFGRAAKTYKVNVAAFDRATTLFTKHFGDGFGRKLETFRHRLAEAVNRGQRVDVGSLAKSAGLDVTRGPFRGRSTRAAMALLALSVFGLTLASGPDDSWRSRATIGATAGTVGISMLDWGPVADVLERRWKAGLSATTKLLSMVVGVTGLIANGLATIEAIEKGDDLGIIEGSLSTVGSAFSFAGWALSLRMGALALAPSLMMTAGSVFIVAGLGIAIWRALSPKEPIDIVNASLESLQEPDSRASIASLEPTIDTLADLANTVSFRPLGPSYESSLVALGYDQDTIAALRGIG